MNTTKLSLRKISFMDEESSYILEEPYRSKMLRPKPVDIKKEAQFKELEFMRLQNHKKK